MLRFSKLLSFCLLTAAFFTFYILFLLLLLNPHVFPSQAELVRMFFDLFSFFGPLWTVAAIAAFYLLQFFAAEKYAIGFFRPPTLTYFFFLSNLIVALILYLNFSYYSAYLSLWIKGRFYLVFALFALMLLLGVAFLFTKKRLRRWVQWGGVVVLVLQCLFSFRVLQLRPAFTPSAPLKASPQPFTPRHVKIVIMEGLSLNLLLSLPAESKLLNFDWIKENGVVARLSTIVPNFEVAMLNTLLSGEKPAEYGEHSHTKFRFHELGFEMDMFPRYVLFKNCGLLGGGVFYRRFTYHCNDMLQEHYRVNHCRTYTLLRPVLFPKYSENKLTGNSTYVQFFSDTLNKADAKLDILRKNFFLDDFLRRQIPELRGTDLFYSLILLRGLENVTRYFYHYAQPLTFRNVDAAMVAKYGNVLAKYYQYYDAIVGKLIASMADDELLVIVSFYEMEPLPIWRRVMVNYLSSQEVFVYKPQESQGVVFLYHKTAVKKGVFLPVLSIYDIYPTLMYYAGFPLSRSTHGQVVRDVFADDFVASNPLTFQLE